MTKALWTILVLGVLGLGILGCRQREDPTPPSDPPWFADVTDEVGLDFVHDCGPTGTYFMPQSVGSGCAFVDVDGDGLEDIYLLHHGGPAGKKNQLFKQLPDGTFKHFTQPFAASGANQITVTAQNAKGQIATQHDESLFRKCIAQRH